MKYFLPLIFAILFSNTIYSETHSGIINSNETWSGTDTVVGNIYVNAGVTLSIMPGSVIYVAGGSLITIYGSLNANGTNTEPITFTSIKASPQPGDWGGIVFNDPSVSSTINNCLVAYGGSSPSYPANISFIGNCDNIIVSNSNIKFSERNGIFSSATSTQELQISGCQFTNNLGHGFYDTDNSSDIQLSNCSFQNNGDFPLRTGADNAGKLTGQLNFTGNQPADMIYLDGSYVYSQIWLNHDVPYYIGSNVYVAASATLGISPGCELMFASNTGLWLFNSTNGKLSANGTGANPILFTSAKANPSPGDWYGIVATNESTLELNYCEVKYAGGSPSYPGGVYMLYADATLSNCLIHQNEQNGIYAYSSNLNFTDLSINNNLASGIYIFSTADNTHIENCNLSDNDQYPFDIPVSAMGDLYGSFNFSGNGQDMINVREGIVEGNAFWRNLDIPYKFNGTISIAAGSLVTIEPGAEFKMGQSSSLNVYGGIEASGTNSQKIAFTSAAVSPSKGDWYGILFFSPSGASTLDNCIIEYGGSSASYPANITFSGNCDSISVSNCIISKSERNGIYSTASNTAGLQIYNCQFTDNNEHGFYDTQTTSDIQLSDCAFQNNGDFPIRTGADNAGKLTGQLNISGNQPYDMIYLDGTTVNSQTWLDHSVPYYLDGSVYVETAKTLNIAPGCELRFAANTGLWLFNNPGAKLLANGTLSEPIVFTSGIANPLPGDWYGIVATNASTLEMNHCEVKYAGGSPSYPGGIYTYFANITLTNCLIHQNEQNGIYAYSSDLSFSDLTLDSNSETGIYIHSATENFLIENCNLTNNAVFPIDLPVADIGNLSDSFAFSGNAQNVINVRSGVVNNSAVWRNLGIPYQFNGSTTIALGSTVNIEPGVVIGGKETDVIIGVYGTLIAEGTQSDPILFTSLKNVPAPGDWDGIKMFQAGEGTLLKHCIVEYAGASFANIDIINSVDNVTILNSIIRYSGNSGIRTSGNSVPNLGTNLNEWNDVVQNTSYGFYNDSPNPQNARIINWGSLNPGEIDVMIFDENDDTNSGLVIYEPFTNAAHDQLFPEIELSYLNVKVFLEGAYAGNNQMQTTLIQMEDFPLEQPFNRVPWNYFGNEFIESIPNAQIVDWVLLDIRDAETPAAASPETSIGRFAGFLLKNGNIVATDGESLISFSSLIQYQLYVAVYHRNHISIMSKWEMAFNNQTKTYSYNFTNGENAFGENALKNLDVNLFGMHSGDGNADGIVDVGDYDIWRSKAGMSGYLQGDFNLDGEADNQDKNEFWFFNRDAQSNVPE